VTMKVYFEGFD